MRVRSVDLGRLHAPIRGEIDAAMARVVTSGRFVMGAEVDAFEEAMALACGARYAVGVSSGSDAILAVLWAAGIGPGDEVLTPAFTFVAAAEAVARLGAIPVFVDVDADLTMSAEKTLARVTERTRAILPVDLFGRRAPIAALGASGIPIFEDAAQAIGVPNLADGVRAATLSFFPTKNLGGFGDGGLVLTNDRATRDAVRELRAHGATERYRHARLGGNLRLDALQAAVLLVKLPYLAAWNRARRRTAAIYLAELRGLPGLGLPRDEASHVWHQLVVLDGERRDRLRAHLASAGVETEIYYPVPLHLQPAFAHLGGRIGDFPEAEAASRGALALPIHPALTDDEVSHVVSSVKAFYRTEGA